MTASISPALLDARQRGARAHQLAKRIAHHTGLDMEAARRAAEIELGHDKPNFEVQTIEGSTWPTDSPYPRWLLPTASLRGGRGNSGAPSKHASRTRR